MKDHEMRALLDAGGEDPERHAGLRTADNRLILKVSFRDDAGNQIGERKTSDPLPSDCDCRHCVKFRAPFDPCVWPPPKE